MNVTEMQVVATNQVNFPIMALVYDCNDDHIIAKIGSAFTKSPEYVDNQTARKYKLYYHLKRETYYFMKDGLRFYLDETLRTHF